MPRNMSFSATIEQMRSRTKTVTRRQGWMHLKPGDVLCAVEKGMGLKKGERVKRIGLIRVSDVRREPVGAVTLGDVTLEGFPDWSREQFVDLYCKLNRVTESDLCTRIEFEHIGGGE